MIAAKTTRLPLHLLVSGLLISTAAVAQLPGSLPKTSMPAPSTTLGTSLPGTSMSAASSTTTDSANSLMTGANTTADSAATQLDRALAASSNGNKVTAVSALTAGVAAAEQQAASSKGDFANKLMNQVGNLKKLIPGVQSGLVSGSVLAKAVALVKMALGANQLSGLLSGGSLLGSSSALTSGLALLKGSLPALGGQSATMGSSLIDGALSSVSKLGGIGGAAAEPIVKQQLGNVLGFAKGLL